MSIEGLNNQQSIDNELSSIKQALTLLAEEIEIPAPVIKARFELLKDADMPAGINRFRIVKDSVNGVKVPGVDIMGNFFECAQGRIDFKLVDGSTFDDYALGSDGNNKTALIMPLPFVNAQGKTEGFTMINGQKQSSEMKNYRGDNALVWFKEGKSGIIKVTIVDAQGKTNKTNETLIGATIKAFDPKQQVLLDQIMDPKNGYSVCQQMSIMYNGQRGCDFVGQSEAAQKEGGGRRYRFFAETMQGKIGVVDFKEDVTINQAITLMQDNGIKNAVYADIIAYNMYFIDKKSQLYTREEGNDGESSYEKVPKDKKSLPNKNSIVMSGM